MGHGRAHDDMIHRSAEGALILERPPASAKGAAFLAVVQLPARHKLSILLTVLSSPAVALEAWNPWFCKIPQR